MVSLGLWLAHRNVPTILPVALTNDKAKRGEKRDELYRLAGAQARVRSSPFHMWMDGRMEKSLRACPLVE